MTPLESVREELAELSRLLEMFTSEPVSPDSAEHLSLQGLLRRQAQLFHEASLLEGHSDLEIRLVGGAESAHRIQADFFGTLVREIQAAVSAVTQTLVRGERGTRGNFPGRVLDASTLVVSLATAGSFVVHLDGPADRALEYAMDDSVQLPPFDEAVQKVRDVIAAVGVDDPGVVRGAIAEIGSHRALIHLSLAARSLARTHTSAVVVQRSPFLDAPMEASLSPERARHLEQLIGLTEQTTTMIRVTGRLSGVLWRRGFFELESTDPHARGMWSGRVVAELREAVDQRFDQVVTAELERTITVVAGDAVRTTYRLVGLDEFPTLMVLEAGRLLGPPADS